MRKITSFYVVLTVLITFSCGERTGQTTQKGEQEPFTKAELFLELPDICPTPDGMTLDQDGNLVLACPNFADTLKPALLLVIDKDRNWKVLDYVPVHPETGFAFPMGIDYGPDGVLYVADNQGWLGTPKGQNQGRILALHFSEGKISDYHVIAYGMSHPNGIKYKNGHLYVTQSLLPAFNTPEMTSGVYRFSVNDRNIKVNNDATDANLLVTYTTVNPNVQYGLDGLVFNKKGDLFVGNFGDGTLFKIEFDTDGNITSNTLFASDENMTTIDGICIDKDENIYVADFFMNRINKVTPEGVVSILAQNEDTDGSDGGLDQPGEPIFFNNVIVVTNFDMVTGPGVLNSGHQKPYTLSFINLNQ